MSTDRKVAQLDEARPRFAYVDGQGYVRGGPTLKNAPKLGPKIDRKPGALYYVAKDGSVMEGGRRA